MTAAKIWYKVIYHDGPEVTAGTKAISGRATVTAEGLLVEGQSTFEIPADKMTDVEMYRLHGSMRMIRVTHVGGTLHITAVRMNLLGLFVIVNFVSAGELFETLKWVKDNPSGDISQLKRSDGPLQISDLPWYEQAWICAPLMLVVVGGAIGGGCGALGMMANRSIFRLRWPTPLKYLATMLVTIASAGVFAVAAALIQALLHTRGH